MANEKKKLTGIETMQKFIKELQKVKDNDYSDVMPFTQITWRKTSKFADVTLSATSEKIGKGNVGIRLKKALSDNCLILELRTNTGVYSTKVICEKEVYKPDPKGEWGVNPLSFYKL